MGRYSECEYLSCGGWFGTTYRCTNNNDAVVSEKCYEKYCREDSDYPTDDCPEYRNNGSICFITISCIKQKLTDSCLELSNLRGYRDSYLLSSEEGRKLVKVYYETSPGIVKAINREPESNKIWDAIYHNYIIPAVELIKKGLNEEALIVYKDMLKTLTNKYSAKTCM